MTLLLRKYRKALNCHQISSARNIEQEIIELASNKSWEEKDRIIEALTLASI